VQVRRASPARTMGTPPASGSLDQMSRIQVVARRGGECARKGTLENVGRTEVAPMSESIIGMATNPTNCCCFASPLWASVCETGFVSFLEVAQQVLFAQHFALQASWLRAFERMQDAAGSWSGRTAIARSTANRMAAFFRMQLTGSIRFALRRSGRSRG
jgi:hypothetical protein